MARHVFNGIRTEEGQKALTNKELADQIVNRMKWDEDESEEKYRTYYANAPVWGIVEDRFGHGVIFDVTGAGYSCISPDLILSTAQRTYEHTGTIRENSDWEQTATTHFQSDQFDTWGTITAPEQHFVLSTITLHAPSLYTEGTLREYKTHLAYTELFKPGEATDVVVTHRSHEDLETFPKVLEEDLRPGFCYHGAPVELCPAGYFPCTEPARQSPKEDNG